MNGMIKIPESIIRSAQHTADSWEIDVSIWKAAESAALNCAKDDAFTHTKGAYPSWGGNWVHVASVLPHGYSEFAYRRV